MVAYMSVSFHLCCVIYSTALFRAVLVFTSMAFAGPQIHLSFIDHCLLPAIKLQFEANNIRGLYNLNTLFNR